VTFVHDDPDFPDLVRIAANKRRLSLGLVEKDYWVTHTLWALHAAGFEIWFKGGTSLSKGFALIERFSEDLDLKIEPGSVTALPGVSTWKSEGTKATAERKGHFEKLDALHRRVPNESPSRLTSCATSRTRHGLLPPRPCCRCSPTTTMRGRSPTTCSGRSRSPSFLARTTWRSRSGAARGRMPFGRRTRPSRLCFGARASRSMTRALPSLLGSSAASSPHADPTSLVTTIRAVARVMARVLGSHGSD